MFIIIGKGSYWVQMRNDDYFGKIKVIFIDLHNKRGRDQFTQIFVRKVHTVKKKENNRVPDARKYGQLMTAIGAVNLRGFHGLLVKQFERYGLADYQVGV
ncbi:MAG: hypothetical protein ACTSYZ_09040 [Candidatus Helarchaeota archaeon]